MGGGREEMEGGRKGRKGGKEEGRKWREEGREEGREEDTFRAEWRSFPKFSITAPSLSKRGSF